MKKIDHKLDPIFGPSGAFAGYFILLVGLSTLFLSIGVEGSMILILIGSFVGLTHTGSTIDPEKNRVRMYTALFGFLKIGGWYGLDQFQTITLTKSVRKHRVYSRSNRQIDTRNVDYRIMLIGINPAQKLPVQKFKTKEAARLELEQLSNQLGLEINLP